MSNTVYPGSIDSPYNPQTTDTLASAPHHLQHGLVNDAVVALETKLGTGASTPSNGTILAGNGAGSSAYVSSLTNFALTTPQITTGIKDANGNTIVGYTPIASAVNNLNIQNNSTGNDVILSAVGSDSNISLDINPKGSGTIKTNGPILLQGGISSSSTGTIPANLFYNPYKFSVYNSSATTIAANSVPTKIAFQTKNYDTSSNFDSATNYRFTAPVAGFYQFNAGVQIFVSNLVVIYSFLYKNGSLLRTGSFGMNASGGANNVTSTLSGSFQLAANDYIELWAQTSQTSTSSTVATAPNTYLDGFLESAT